MADRSLPEESRPASASRPDAEASPRGGLAEFVRALHDLAQPAVRSLLPLQEGPGRPRVTPDARKAPTKSRRAMGAVQ